MFMRFFGTGIGHKATYNHTAALRKDALAMAHMQSTYSATEDEFPSEVEGPEAQFSEKEDYGYELGSDAEDEGDEEDDGDANLGAEDGEEPWEVDDLHAERYDDL
jgi:hypothetical protein